MTPEEEAALEAEKKRQAELLAKEQQQPRSYFFGGSRPLDPAFQPGAIAAATAPQPLQTATRPGEAALDIVPIGTPLMSVKGVQDAFGKTQYVPLQPNRPDSFHDLVGNAIDAKSAAISARKQQIMAQLQTANRYQATRLATELRGLEHDEEFAQRERHYATLEKAHERDKMFDLSLQTEKANQFANMVSAFMAIPKDAPDREAQIEKAIASNPLGATTTGGLSAIGKIYDRPAPTAQAVKDAIEAVKPLNLQPAGITITQSGKPSVRFETPEQAQLKSPVMKKAANDLAGIGLSVEEFQSRDTSKVARGTYTKSTGKFTGSNKGGDMRVEIGGTPYFMSVAAYDRLNKVLPATGQTKSESPVKEVIRDTQDGRKAVFDAATKKFLRYAE